MMTVGAERGFLVDPVVSAERILLIEAIIEARAPSIRVDCASLHIIPVARRSR
jgi:hypothetical protein